MGRLLFPRIRGVRGRTRWSLSSRAFRVA
ncbi:hypothetical protein [Streptosporangium sp. NPDC023615]